MARRLIPITAAVIATTALLSSFADGYALTLVDSSGIRHTFSDLETHKCKTLPNAIKATGAENVDGICKIYLKKNCPPNTKHLEMEPNTFTPFFKEVLVLSIICEEEKVDPTATDDLSSEPM